MTAEARKASEKRGRQAELYASWYLRLKGYQIIALRAKTHVGEIDILARKQKLVTSVEVKQRRTLNEGLNAVSERSWQRIGNATDSYLAHKAPAFYEFDRRFDLIVVLPFFQICHKQDVWRPDFA